MDRRWYLVAYDVRDPARLHRTAKILKGFGDRVQLSVFKVHASQRQIERLRWELLRVLEEEDFLLVVGLCVACVDSIYKKGGVAWRREDTDVRFRVV